MKREASPLKKIIEESPKIRALREKRRRAKKRLLILLGVLFLVLVGAFVYFSRYPKLQIARVDVVGNQVIDTSDVVAAVNADLAGNYAYVIPHRNAFFYPKKKIVADLIQKFPRFQGVQVWRENLSTVLVTVSEVRGRALWCGEDTTNPSNDVPCYFTDSSGKIVSAAPTYSGNVYLRFFGGSVDPSDTDPLGKSFIDPASFQNLLAFDAGLSNLGFNVRAVLIGTDGSDTFVLDVGQGNTATIPFIATDDYAVLMANLTAALNEPTLEVKLKSDKANLQYIDLRFTNKVYYKFTDDNTTVQPPDTSASGSYQDLQ